MGPARIVLDTNVFRGAHVDLLSTLHARGHRISVSQIAYVETWANSASAHRAGMPRDQARGKFFGRARSIARFIDENEPIALAGGLLAKRIESAVAGSGPHQPSEERATALRAQWRHVAGVGLSDEEWLELGEDASASLDDLDAQFSGIGAGFARNLGKVAPTFLPGAPPELTQELIALAHSWWHEAEDLVGGVDMKLEHFCSLIEHEWGVSSDMSDRIDAALRSFAFRLRTAASGARRPKRNDGADLRLPFHIGDGFVLLTSEKQLVDIVDACGTHQAPWIRRPNDLEDLPTCEPWGTEAWTYARGWKRRTS